MAQAAGEAARTLGLAEAHRLGWVVAPAQEAEVAAAAGVVEAARSCKGGGSDGQCKPASSGVLLLLMHSCHAQADASADATVRQLCEAVRHPHEVVPARYAAQLTYLKLTAASAPSQAPVELGHTKLQPLKPLHTLSSRRAVPNGTASSTQLPCPSHTLAACRSVASASAHMQPLSGLPAKKGSN